MEVTRTLDKKKTHQFGGRMLEEGKGGVELCNELGFRFLRQLEDILKMQDTLRSPRKMSIHQELQVDTLDTFFILKKISSMSCYSA
jgi:hypothetical protein